MTQNAPIAPTETVAFRLSPPELERLNELAARQNNAVSRIVRRIVADHLAKRESHQ